MKQYLNNTLYRFNPSGTTSGHLTWAGWLPNNKPVILSHPVNCLLTALAVKHLKRASTELLGLSMTVSLLLIDGKDETADIVLTQDPQPERAFWHWYDVENLTDVFPPSQALAICKEEADKLEFGRQLSIKFHGIQCMVATVVFKQEGKVTSADDGNEAEAAVPLGSGVGRVDDNADRQERGSQSPSPESDA